MKTLPTNKLIGFIASAYCATALIACPMAGAAQPEKKNDPGFLQKMEQWQDRMSDKFRDTWKKLRSDSKEKSVATASVDLREDQANYTVRLNLPDRKLDQVEIKLEGDALRIVAPAEDKAGRYEQTIVLADADPLAKPNIERKQSDNLIVVTVPKSSPLAGGKHSLTLPDPSLLPLTDWDRDVFTRMEKMRRDMDRAFEDAFHEFRGSPDHQGFFDEPRFGSSLDLKEEGDNYVVRLYLPERDMQNVNVTVENQTLKIEAKEQEITPKKEDAKALHRSRQAAYSQIFTLPGPVQGEKMKVEKKESMLVVTLPKAK